LDLYPDPAAAIAETEAAGIYTLTVTTTPRAWPVNLRLTRNGCYVRAALGLHPQLVAKHADELTLFERYLPETRYVGEVGLDAGPRFYSSFDLQKDIFERILGYCALAGGKILTVHSVRSAKIVLDLIDARLPSSQGTVVLHWFTGSKSDARRALALGCYFSINAAMLASDKGRALIAEIPLDRLLTETDGPFTQVNGHPAYPANVALVIEQLAKLRTMPPHALAEAVISNLRRILREPSDTVSNPHTR
jgi:TatD DNase family protein